MADKDKSKKTAEDRLTEVRDILLKIDRKLNPPQGGTAATAAQSGTADKKKKGEEAPPSIWSALSDFTSSLKLFAGSRGLREAFGNMKGMAKATNDTIKAVSRILEPFTTAGVAPPPTGSDATSAASQATDTNKKNAHAKDNKNSNWTNVTNEVTQQVANKLGGKNTARGTAAAESRAGAAAAAGAGSAARGGAAVAGSAEGAAAAGAAGAGATGAGAGSAAAGAGGAGAGAGGAATAAGAGGAGAGAGGAAAGAGGGAAAGGVAALASNPVGWAIAAVIAVAAVAAAMVILPHLIKNWSRSLLESQRDIAEVSGKMAAVFAKKDVADIHRQQRIGDATADSAGRLSEALIRLENKFEPFIIIVTNFLNNVATVFVNLASAMLEAIVMQFNMVIRVIDELLRWFAPHIRSITGPLDQIALNTRPKAENSQFYDELRRWRDNPKAARQQNGPQPHRGIGPAR